MEVGIRVRGFYKSHETKKRQMQDTGQEFLFPQGKYTYAM